MIKTKKKTSKIEIDLSGPQGNALFLMAQANKLAAKFNLDWPVIREEMKSGDYKNLVQVFDKYFGGFVTLYR